MQLQPQSNSHWHNLSPLFIVLLLCNKRYLWMKLCTFHITAVICMDNTFCFFFIFFSSTVTLVGRWVFLVVPAHPGSPGQRAVKRLLLCVLCILLLCTFTTFHKRLSSTKGTVKCSVLTESLKMLNFKLYRIFCFSETSSVAMHLSCGGISNDHLITNLLPSLRTKKTRES